MTATRYDIHVIACNGTSSDSSPCPEEFAGKPGEARGSVRQRARNHGWVTVQSPRGRDWQTDFCKWHREQAGQ